MPLATDSPLTTISAVLTKDQVRRLNALRELRSAPYRRVGFSEILREAVEVGIDAILRGPDSTFQTSPTNTEESAA